MSNRQRPRNPALAMRRRPNVADEAWAAHRQKVQKDEIEKHKHDTEWLRRNFNRWFGQ